MKGIVALCVSDIRIGAMGYEYLDDIEVAIAGGPLHGSGDEVTTESIDLCPLFQQIAAGRELSVNCSPMKWSDILFIAVCRPCTPRLYEFSDKFEVATLSG